MDELIVKPVSDVVISCSRDEAELIQACLEFVAADPTNSPWMRQEVLCVKDLVELARKKAAETRIQN